MAKSSSLYTELVFRIWSWLLAYVCYIIHLRLPAACFLDAHGKSQFRDLLFHRAELAFYAFDILWDQHAWSDNEQERRRFGNGEDLRFLPLTDRKHRLRAMLPRKAERLLYCDHVDADGEGLFRLACEHDLEGIVAKRKTHPYLPNRETSWFKVRNQSYSQWAGREEFFECERGGNPDAIGSWEGCAAACAAAGL